MKTKLARRLAGSLLAVMLVVLCLSDAQSQQRRRTSRRTTHPARPQPVQTPALPDEPSVISTADDQQEGTPRRTTTTTRARQSANTQAENERLHGTVRDLSSQVEQLSGQLNQMKTDQRAMFDLERLTRAEQRAEDLRRQLREVTDKEFQYQERIAEIDYESQPDSIQRRAALVGSLNPSAVRDAIQQQLERERTRIQKQLELLAASHARLEASVAASDAEVERLRQRVEAADQTQAIGPPATAAPDTTNNVNTTPQPSPTPTPAQPPG
jgi:outer membrane murein-binding lipoprotein Lpp